METQNANTGHTYKKGIDSGKTTDIFNTHPCDRELSDSDFIELQRQMANVITEKNLKHKSLIVEKRF